MQINVIFNFSLIELNNFLNLSLVYILLIIINYLTFTNEMKLDSDHKNAQNLPFL